MTRGTLMVAAGIVLGAVGMTAARNDEKHESVRPLAVREIAETIGCHLGVPAVSIPADKATEHFGPFGAIMTLGIPPMSNASTRQLLGWEPDHPGLIADLDQGHYFAGQ